MSGASKMSIAERVAALQKQGKNDVPLPLTKPTKLKSDKTALAGRIAALQMNVDSAAEGGVESKPKDAPKVGKLKPPPAGAVPIMMPFGSGLPPSMLKKKKEREERMARLRQEANADSAVDGSTEPLKRGEPKPFAGAVPMVPFGLGMPHELLEKQKERAERTQQEATEKKTEEDVEDALLSRPTIQGGKRRPRTRA